MTEAAAATLDRAIGAFTATLREVHGFGVGHATTHDALRAVDVVGVADGARLRRALRAVYCGSPSEAARFDAAFDEFFFGTLRATRPSAPPRTAVADAPRARAGAAGETWRTLHARYSAAAAVAEPPVVPVAGLDAAFAAARRLLARVRIAPSRRRVPRRRGDRPDLRRTLRASVATAGDPIDLRRTARDVRTPRFALMIDGSRSTAHDAGPMLQFAFALVRSTPRASVYVFSTALRDVTPQLRNRRAAGAALPDLGEAWGGGTRIGASVRAFVHEHGGRALGRDTVVLLFSDGLDAGDLGQLAPALRELRARSARLVWLHPHAGAPGFAPSTAALRIAQRYVEAFHPAGEPSDFERLAARMECGATSLRRCRL